MSYILYNKETTKIVPRRDGSRSFATKAAATAAMTRYSLYRGGRPGFNKDDHMIAEESDFYANIEKKEIRKGIVGSAGKDFEVGVNTPWSSGPWSESYWCS